MNDKEKELILQGIDFLIEEVEYSIEHGVKGLKKYREIKLSDLKILKKKIIDGKIIILDPLVIKGKRDYWE